jgi:hypothetical protein
MSENIVYLRCASAPIAPNTIGAIVAGTYSQLLTFDFSTVVNTYNQQYFNLYRGDGVATNYRFPISSNCVIKALRLSIPNLPGSRFALNPNGATQLIRQGFTIGVAGFKQPPVAPINAAPFYIGVNQLEEWVPTNILINANDYLTDGIDTAVYYYLSFGGIGVALNQPVYVDFRNYQTAFDAINIYLLAELQVIAPAGVL